MQKGLVLFVFVLTAEHKKNSYCFQNNFKKSGGRYFILD